MSRGQGKADEAKAAMLYMRRLHSDPATAPAGDLADLADADYDAADVALGPEGEGLPEKDNDNNKRRQARCNRLAKAISPINNM